MSLQPLVAKSFLKRKIIDSVVKIISMISASIGIVVLCFILYEVVSRGVSALNIDFFTQLPAPPYTPGGGIANAIAGTFLLTLLATLIGVPVGVFTGVYLAEFGKDNKFSGVVRFVINILNASPSIIIGLFVYSIIVVPMGHFSGYAGMFALAILMLPVVSSVTEEMINMVPNAMRESAYALGTPCWKVTLQIVFRMAKKGLITGILLSIARISGETAPLLFTAFNSPYWSDNFNQPIANMTVTIFNFAMSPYADWQQIAWGASLLIMVAILFTNIFVRVLFQDKKG